MPDLITHQYFGKQVLETLPKFMSEGIREDIFYHTTPGPDIWFTLGFYGGKNKAKSPRGNYMHHHDTGAFLAELAKQCRACEDTDGMFSYLAGFLCHYSLDSVAHPYIFYSTGEYDGSEETRSVRGNHTRLERAIDCYILREKYGLVPGSFSITDTFLPLRQLPETMRDGLDAAYKTVYGWEDVWSDLNTAIGDQRFFYRVMRGRTGLINFITGLYDNGKTHLDHRLLSYHDRDLDSAKVDYLNESHRLWHHHLDEAMSSSASFPELMELARQKATQLIDIIYYYVYQNVDYDLPSLLGNDSYATGLDCLDPRNENPGVYQPLF